MAQDRQRHTDGRERVVDQHRAHERVLFERNLKLLESGAGLTQTELFPRHVELNAADLAMVEEVLPDLRKMGFDLELFGGRTVQVNGMPAEAAEMLDLIDRLFACEMPYTTSSGKPTLITYGLDELNERFER